MHDYAIFDHDRAFIGRWVGIFSLVLASSISQLTANIFESVGIVTNLTVTAGTVYFGIDWIFNKFIWKWLCDFKILPFPNLGGTWLIEGKTLDADGNTTFDWNGKLVITQNWRKILIHLQTASSQSDSYTATVSKIASGGWQLSYSYKNEPELEQSHELNAHKGFCEIEINDDLTLGKASYFNSNRRRTFGVMNLSKELNNG